MTAAMPGNSLKTTLKSGHSGWDPNDTIVILTCSMTLPEYAFWLWTPALASLECLVVSCQEDSEALAEIIINRPADRWRPTDPARLKFLSRYMLSPHAAIPTGSGVLVCGSLDGLSTYLLDTKSGSYSRLWQNQSPPAWSYSPTPGLNAARDQLFTARWQIQNHNNPPDQTHYSEIVSIDLKNGAETVYARTPITDNIHQVALMPDERHLLLNEFQTGLNSPAPDLSGLNSRERLETLRRIGVKLSRLALVDLVTGEYTEWTCPWPSPAHMVFDPDDPNLFYLACHNMVVEAGEMYLFGPGCLVKIRIQGQEFKVEGHYSHSKFHRLSTHDMITCRGRKAIAITVFPNRCEIIDAEDFTQITSVELYPIAQLTAEGVALANNQVESAFSVCGTGTDDRLVLSGSKRIYVVDVSQEPAVVESLVYNADPTWVVRAHMTKLA